MRLSFYYIPRFQITSLGVTYLDTIQTTTILSLELRNIKGQWKKLMESKKNTKILEKHYIEIGQSFFFIKNCWEELPTVIHTNNNKKLPN